MNQSMVGADVDALDALARALHRGAQDLKHIEVGLRNLPRDVWRGPDAARFFDHADTTLYRQLTAAANGLDSASTTASQNANEQRTASAAGGAGAGGSAGAGGGPGAGASAAPGGGSGSSASGAAHKGPLSFADNVFSLSKDFTGKGLGVLEHFAKNAGDEAYFKGLGVVLGAGSLADSVSKGEWSQSLVDAMHIGTSFLPTLPGAVADAGLDTFEMNVPITAERQTDVLNYRSMQEFGRPASELTPAESARLSSRYEGAGGVLNMMHDSVLESTSNPKSLVAVGIKGAGEFVADVVWAEWEAGIKPSVDGLKAAFQRTRQ